MKVPLESMYLWVIKYGSADTNRVAHFSKWPNVMDPVVIIDPYLQNFLLILAAAVNDPCFKFLGFLAALKVKSTLGSIMSATRVPRRFLRCAPA